MEEDWEELAGTETTVFAYFGTGSLNSIGRIEAYSVVPQVLIKPLDGGEPFWWREDLCSLTPVKEDDKF
jgi:hypothetical protein